MTATTVTNLRKNIFSMVESSIRFNEPIYITSKEGNAVLISEDEYRGMLETIALLSNPKMKEELIEGMNTPLSEMVPEDEVAW